MDIARVTELLDRITRALPGRIAVMNFNRPDHSATPELMMEECVLALVDCTAAGIVLISRLDRLILTVRAEQDPRPGERRATAPAASASLP